MDNELMNEYKKAKDVIKARSDKDSKILLTKDAFLNYLYQKMDKNVFDDLIKEFTPKEYFIKEAIKNDPNLKDKFFNLLKDEK